MFHSVTKNVYRTEELWSIKKINVFVKLSRWREKKICCCMLDFQIYARTDFYDTYFLCFIAVIQGKIVTTLFFCVFSWSGFTHWPYLCYGNVCMYNEREGNGYTLAYCLKLILCQILFAKDLNSICSSYLSP